MRRRMLVAAAAALVGVSAGGEAALAHYHCAGPASNFSAYDYQSPGGMRGAGRAKARAPGAADTEAVPYPRSCGKGRVWRDGRCVRS
jgi:hypothetical protein